MTSKRLLAVLTVVAVLAGAAAAAPAFAQTAQPPMGPGLREGQVSGRAQNGMMMRVSDRPPGVFGTVTAINGTSLSVASMGFGPNAATTTYSVDASNATIFKGDATTTVSGIATGDRIAVEGSISGTNVTATIIHDGFGTGRIMHGDGQGDDQGRGIGPMGPEGEMGEASGTAALIKGNGEPVVAGTVSSVSGNVITITTGSNTSYSVDASSATIVKGNSSSSVSSISTGDFVVVQGAISGTNVTASSVIDHAAQPANAENGTSTPNGAPEHKGGLGFFGAIGGFFRHLFGF
ncbi:MAG: hypothetical protein KGI79_00095 [Patescibacteria group bacterium]|nr:hypothetical protein [Patescibacteria group bacterium]MDE2116271.1 hypothetical protein [Patescibacteria group bacterium]